jgi:hypothetical protein
MAKQVIVLGVNQTSLWTSVNAAFWFPITQSGTAKAALSGSVWAGASAAENTAIQTGTVVEEPQSFQFPTGLAVASIKDFLLTYWTRRNAQIGGVGANLYNGVFADSLAGWSA